MLHLRETCLGPENQDGRKRVSFRMCVCVCVCSAHSHAFCFATVFALSLSLLTAVTTSAGQKAVELNTASTSATVLTGIYQAAEDSGQRNLAVGSSCRWHSEVQCVIHGALVALVVPYFPPFFGFKVPLERYQPPRKGALIIRRYLGNQGAAALPGRHEDLFARHRCNRPGGPLLWRRLCSGPLEHPSRFACFFLPCVFLFFGLFWVFEV